MCFENVSMSCSQFGFHDLSKKCMHIVIQYILCVCVPFFYPSSKKVAHWGNLRLANVESYLFLNDQGFQGLFNRTWPTNTIGFDCRHFGRSHPGTSNRRVYNDLKTGHDYGWGTDSLRHPHVLSMCSLASDLRIPTSSVTANLLS